MIKQEKIKDALTLIKENRTMEKYKFTVQVDGKDIEVWKIDHDLNGNPRYVIHFLVLAQEYNEALRKVRSIGGRKLYGDGLVFSSYSLEDDLKHALKA
jgi:hypothetical protein